MKTNIEYKVVASFVTQSETTGAIKEALSIIMKWNPDWAPKHFMVDYAEEAVEDLFPDTSDTSKMGIMFCYLCVVFVCSWSIFFLFQLCMKMNACQNDVQIETAV